jgi:hypothetical protein
MNICKLSIVIILQRYSQNLPYSTFLTCWVHWYKFTSRFASIRGRVSIINNLLHTSYCTVFFVWVFFLWVSHIKFLMRQYQHKIMSCHPFFPIGVFGGRYWDIRCIVLFSLCEFSLWGFSYKVFDEAMSTQKYMLYHLFFPPGFLYHMIKVFLD